MPLSMVCRCRLQMAVAAAKMPFNVAPGADGWGMQLPAATVVRAPILTCH